MWKGWTLAKKLEARESRRARVDQLRKDRQRAERRRTIPVVAVCVVVGAVIIGLAAHPLVTRNRAQGQFNGKALDQIGAAASSAGCRSVATQDATGGSDHRQVGTAISYSTAPPASGPHWAVPAPFSWKFHTGQDRPAVPTLVHNLEHGCTILWDDERVAKDTQQVAEVRAIARVHEKDDGGGGKFIAAPWTAKDGDPFPGRAHVAGSHWSAGTSGSAAQARILRYCSKGSGETVSTFVKRYPFSDSPEPTAGRSCR